jgi:D-ribulokinase
VEFLGLGIDLGTSGLRVAVVNAAGNLLETKSSSYPLPFSDANGWQLGVAQLVKQLSTVMRQQVAAIAIDGTSGTLLACNKLGIPLAPALPYSCACGEQCEAIKALVPSSNAAASSSGSLARALQLLQQLEWQTGKPVPLLRHQADWLMGWLLGDWRWGEEGNNLRLGWDLLKNQWAGQLGVAPWAEALPQIVASGQTLGLISAAASAALGIPQTCQVVSGSTDANAMVLAANPKTNDGICVLGTTLVLKQFNGKALHGAGISNHRINGRWLVGGASNAGAGVLRQFFNDQQLKELSRQIDPSRPSGLHYMPLPAPGERFPIENPDLQPILEPRPISDALFLQGMLEGLSKLEQQGWQRLQELGASPIKRVLTVGGGACNPQWRNLRELALGIPVLNLPNASAATAMAFLALQSVKVDR